MHYRLYVHKSNNILIMKEKKKLGGSRPGAGRKKKEGYQNATFYLSSDLLGKITYMSKTKLISKNEIVNSILYAAFKAKK